MTCEITPRVEFTKEILSKTGTDHDGVMADTRTMVAETFNGWFGTKHKPEEISGWHMVKNWGLAIGLSEKAAEEIENKIWFGGDLLFNAKPIEGAIEFMKQAYDKGIEIPIISSRPPRLKDATLAWYQKHMPFVNLKSISVGMEDIDQDLTKVWMILRRNQTPLMLFLEDSPEHAKHILESTGATVILISNNTSLDQFMGKRLFRVGTTNGKMPTLWPVYNAFFGKRQ